jgi:REP element-mobilizing transposase RayT
MKPGTYTQLFVQLIFAVKNRDAVLHKKYRQGIFKYMGGILTNLKHKPIIINGTNNHVHILFGLNPDISISKTVHDIKRNSSLFINDNRMCMGKFQWQEGYGAFTYSRSQLDKVYNYIQNQEEHHSNKTFREEYVQFLEKFEVEYDNRFLFNFFE